MPRTTATAAAATAKAATVATAPRLRVRRGVVAGARKGDGSGPPRCGIGRHLLRTLVALGQPADDARPQAVGRFLDRVAQGTRHLAQPVELGPTARTGVEVLLDLGHLVDVDGVERVGTQQLAGLLVRDHASTPLTPASTKTARMRRMPLRMRLLTVPSGCPSSRATSR